MNIGAAHPGMDYFKGYMENVSKPHVSSLFKTTTFFFARCTSIAEL
jgi:hypothetical protein